MDEVVVTSRIRLARNLSDVPFTIKMNDYDAGLVIDRVRDVISKINNTNLIFMK